MFCKSVIKRHVIFAASFALLYLLANRPEVIIIAQLGSAAWYPATGLTIAVMLAISPWYALLAVLSGVSAGMLIYHQPLLSYGQTIGAVGFAAFYAGGAYVLRGPLRIDLTFRQRRDVVLYTAVTTVAALCAAGVGVSCLAGDHSIAWRDFWPTALLWFLGDEIGLLAVAPFLLVHVLPGVRRNVFEITDELPSEWNDARVKFGWWAALEALAEFMSVCAVLAVMFGPEFGRFQLFFLSFIPVVWIAMRHGIRRTVTGLLVLNCGIVMALRFYAPTPAPALVVKIALLMFVVSATGLLMGSAVSERWRIDQELLDRSRELQLQTKTLEATKAELQVSEAKYRAIFEDAVIGIFQRSPDGRTLSANRALAKMAGYETPEQLMADVSNAGELYVHPDQRDELQRHLVTEGSVLNFEYQILRKDGKKVWLLQNTRAVKDGQGNVVYYEGTVQDITGHKLLEEQFLQSQKMEAVGRLAGGIAHDFNNALSVISGYSELLQLNLSADNPMRRGLQEIYKAGQRGASLTRQLLAFSRKQPIQPVVIDMNVLVKRTLEMLRRLVGEDIELHFLPESRSAKVKVDPVQIEQVFMNLAVNARDAMPDGGDLSIRIGAVELNESYVQDHPYAKTGQHIVVCVSDSGFGMDKETQAHIFEPFFTTKGAGKGTGLGLSTVYGIIEQSGGHVTVYSEPGMGTTFRLYFPATEDDMERVSVVPDPKGLPRGVETILLVEDEDSIRELTRGNLERGGYKVLEASDGQAALQIAARYSQPIHLLLTDVIMPGLDGRALADSILRSRPGIKFLFMSGYTDDLIVHKGVLQPGTALLEKPFNLQSLLSKVREVLDKEVAITTGR